MWRDPGGSWACLPPAYKCNHPATVCDMWKELHSTLKELHSTLKELHSTGETIVWRDPVGSWDCLPPVYNYEWNHPATGCDMWTTPKKHTKNRETLGNTNQNKAIRRAGYKVYEKKTQRKHSKLKEPYAMLHKTKTLTKKIARQKKGQRKSPNMNQSNSKGTLQKPLWEEQSPIKC